MSSVFGNGQFGSMYGQNVSAEGNIQINTRHSLSLPLNIPAGFFPSDKYEGWNFNSGNYLFTTDTK